MNTTIAPPELAFDPPQPELIDLCTTAPAVPALQIQPAQSFLTQQANSWINTLFYERPVPVKKKIESNLHLEQQLTSEYPDNESTSPEAFLQRMADAVSDSAPPQAEDDGGEAISQLMPEQEVSAQPQAASEYADIEGESETVSSGDLCQNAVAATEFFEEPVQPAQIEYAEEPIQQTQVEYIEDPVQLTQVQYAEEPDQQVQLEYTEEAVQPTVESVSESTPASPIAYVEESSQFYTKPAAEFISPIGPFEHLAESSACAVRSIAHPVEDSLVHYDEAVVELLAQSAPEAENEEFIWQPQRAQAIPVLPTITPLNGFDVRKLDSNNLQVVCESEDVHVQRVTNIIANGGGRAQTFCKIFLNDKALQRTILNGLMNEPGNPLSQIDFLYKELVLRLAACNKARVVAQMLLYDH